MLPECQALETWISRSRRPSASPESSDFFAAVTPSLRFLVRPATTSAAAALNTAISRNGPLLPLSTASSAAALASASPPRSASGLALGRPTSSGAISKVLTAPFSSAATLGLRMGTRRRRAETHRRSKEWWVTARKGAPDPPYQRVCCQDVRHWRHGSAGRGGLPPRRNRAIFSRPSRPP